MSIKIGEKEKAKNKIIEENLREKTIKSSSKVVTDNIVPINCPECQCELRKIKVNHKYFYRCGNYPNCKYEECIEN